MAGRVFCGIALVLLLGVVEAGAATITFSDETAFLNATGATSATGPLPNLGLVGLGPVTIGDLTLTSASGNLYVGGSTDWTTRLPGNDIAISDREHLDVDVNLSDSFSFGFRFVEPEFDPNLNAAFVDSTFTVTLKSGATFVDSASFNAPNDTAAFFGVWTSTSFDRVEIRETVGGIGNEFFGEMFAGATPVPLPAPGLLTLLGLTFMAGFSAHRRRRMHRA